MATIDYTEAQFTTSGGAVDAEQLRQEFPVPPARFTSTPATVTDVQVFEPGDNPIVTLTTDVTLDATDIATALAVVNNHTALGPSDGLTEGGVEGFGGYGRRQNYLLFSEELDNAEWDKPFANATVTPNNALAPNGEMTADLVTWTTAGLGLRQTMVGIITDQVYGVSFWARHVSGNNLLQLDLRDGPGTGGIPIDTTFRRYHVDLLAGASGDFLDVTVIGTVGAFELWGLQVTDRTLNHVHPYMKTTDERMVTDEFGAVVDGDQALTGVLKYLDTPNREGASRDALTTIEVYKAEDFGTAELALDGNMRVPLIINTSYQVMRTNIVLPLVTLPEASDVDFGGVVEIEGHHLTLNILVADTSAPIIWGRGGVVEQGVTGLILRNVSIIDISNAGAGLGVKLFDLVGTGGASSFVLAEVVNYFLLKSVGDFVDVFLPSSLTRHVFCESGITVRTNATASLPAAVGYTSAVFLANSLLPDVRRPGITWIGSAGKSVVNVASVNLGKATNSAFHVDLFATGSTVFSNIGYLGPTVDGEFFRPTLVTAITEQVESTIVITGFSDSVVNPGVDTTVEFASVMPFTRGQQIRIQQEAAYNGLQTIVRVAADQLSFDINVVHSTSGAANIRHTEHIVADCKFSVGETVAISGTTNYNVNQNIVAVTDTSFTFNQVFVGDDGTGTATSNGQDETSEFVTTALTGDQKESRSIGSVVATGNATATTINTINIWESLDLDGAAVAGANIELWGQVDADTCAVTYLGAPAFNGSMVAALSATSSGGTQRFQFRVRIDGVVVADLASVDIGSNMKRVAILAPLTDVLTSHVVDIQVRNTGGTSDVLIEDISIEIQ